MQQIYKKTHAAVWFHTLPFTGVTIQIHELRIQIHELQVQIRKLWNQVHELGD